jgi:hypothetical protein
MPRNTDTIQKQSCPIAIQQEVQLEMFDKIYEEVITIPKKYIVSEDSPIPSFE